MYRNAFGKDSIMRIILDDEPVWTPAYKRLPKDALNIPSLYMMGHAKFNKAWTALETHYHNTLEVVVILSGSQQYIVNDSLYSLHGGNMFVTYPNEVHGNGFMPQNVCEFIWFQLDLSRKEGFLGLNSEFGARLYLQITNCRKRTMDVDREDLALLRLVWEMLSCREADKRLLGYSYLVSFLAKYFCEKNCEESTQTISPDIQQALCFIRENLSGDVGIAGIASACKLSESRFKTKFRAQMGIPPMVYINSLKIDQAKRMLRETAMPVTEIAFALNFSSSNYFSSVFRQYTGYSPSDFRRAVFQPETLPPSTDAICPAPLAR